MKKKLEGLLQLITVIFSLIFLNFISNIYYFKYDLTSNKRYSVSSCMKDILSNLKETVNVTAYFSKDVNHELTERARYLENFLNELKNYSKGKLIIKFTDPSSLSDKDKHNLRLEGIAPIQLNSIKNDKYEVSVGYLGVSIRSLDRKEVIPALVDEEKLEYELYNKIKIVTDYPKKRISILNLSEKTSFKKALQLIEELYKVEDSEQDTLLIFAADKEISDEELKKLDKHLLEGKKIIIFISRYKVDISSNNVEEINKKLREYFENKGIHISEDLIYDNQSAKIKLASWPTPIIMNYPYFIIVNDFNKDVFYTKSLTNALIPFASGIQIKEAKLKLEKLFSSSNDSYRYTAYNLNPFAKLQPAQDSEKGPFNIASRIYESDKEKGLDLIIISSVETVEDNNIDMNLNLFLNLIDGSLDNKDVIAIRDKNSLVKNMKPISNKWKTCVKYINYLFVPTLVSLIGIFVFIIRMREENDKYQK